MNTKLELWSVAATNCPCAVYYSTHATPRGGGQLAGKWLCGHPQVAADRMEEGSCGKLTPKGKTLRVINNIGQHLNGFCYLNRQHLDFT